MKTDQSEYLIVVDTASLLQTPPSDQIFLELEFDKKLSNSKLERYIKSGVILYGKVALESRSQLRQHWHQRADNDPGEVWKQSQTVHFTKTNKGNFFKLITKILSSEVFKNLLPLGALKSILKTE